MATLSGFFGALAAILAMIGLYSVMSFMVVCRRNEIGVRMALGADRRDILGMMLREAATLVAIGLGAGSLLAVAAATTARTLLDGLQPSDPVTLALAAAGLTIVALSSTCCPPTEPRRSTPSRPSARSRPGRYFAGCRLEDSSFHPPRIVVALQ